MADGRYIHSNAITSASMITPSSLKTGFVDQGSKEGAGSAILIPSGDFTGSEDMKYLLTIDSVAAGNEIGQATFLWYYITPTTTTLGGSGVVTDSIPILLNNGVYVKWTAGTGNDFELDDKFYFDAYAHFGVGNMLIYDRDIRHRTADATGAPATWEIDLGSAKSILAVVLYDHNLTSGATISIQMHTAAADWANPAVITEVITYNADKILHYITTSPSSYKYWRLRIEDTANPDNYLQIGYFGLMTYSAFSKSWNIGYSRDIRAITQENVNDEWGQKSIQYTNEQVTFSLPYRVMPQADITVRDTIFNSVLDRANKGYKPLFFNFDSTSPNDFWMMFIDPRGWKNRKIPANLRNDFDINLEEVLTSL